MRCFSVLVKLLCWIELSDFVMNISAGTLYLYWFCNVVSYHFLIFIIYVTKVANAMPEQSNWRKSKLQSLFSTLNLQVIHDFFYLILERYVMVPHNLLFAYTDIASVIGDFYKFRY